MHQQWLFPILHNIINFTVISRDNSNTSFLSTLFYQESASHLKKFHYIWEVQCNTQPVSASAHMATKAHRKFQFTVTFIKHILCAWCYDRHQKYVKICPLSTWMHTRRQLKVMGSQRYGHPLFCHLSLKTISHYPFFTLPLPWSQKTAPIAWIGTTVLYSEGVHMNPKDEMELSWWAPGAVWSQGSKDLKLHPISIWYCLSQRKGK